MRVCSVRLPSVLIPKGEANNIVIVRTVFVHLRPLLPTLLRSRSETNGGQQFNLCLDETSFVNVTCQIKALSKVPTSATTSMRWEGRRREGRGLKRS